jgi:hypothetical protein
MSFLLQAVHDTHAPSQDQYPLQQPMNHLHLGILTSELCIVASYVAYDSTECLQPHTSYRQRQAEVAEVARVAESDQSHLQYTDAGDWHGSLDDSNILQGARVRSSM